VRDFPRRGWTITSREAEPPFEAEATFEGHGRRGGWRVAALRDCGGMAVLLVAVTLPS
jgi:hypothetical protein